MTKDVNTLIRESSLTVGNTDVPSALRIWAIAAGATNDLGRQDAEAEGLRALGYTGTLTDMWYAFLVDQGYTGGFATMYRDYWLNSPAFGGGGADPAFGDVVLLLDFDTGSGTLIYDHSCYDHTITVQGDATVKRGSGKNSSGSVLLDGTGDYLDITTGEGDLDPAGVDYTIEMWVKTTALGAGRKTFLACRAAGATQHGWALWTTDGTASEHFLAFTAWAGSGGTTAIDLSGATTNLNDYINQWVHIAAVRYNATSEWAIYVNGIRENIGTETTTISQNKQAGKLGKDATDNTRDLAAYIDSVRVTKGTARYTGASFTVPEPEFPLQSGDYTLGDEFWTSTMLLWHCDDDVDSGPMRRSTINAPADDTGSLSASADRYAVDVADLGISYDTGTTQQGLKTQSFVWPDEFTLEYDLYPTTNANPHWCAKADSAFNTPYNAYGSLGASGLDLTVRDGTGAGTAMAVTSGVTYTLNAWNSIALSRYFDGTNYLTQWYVDGCPSGSPHSSATPVQIGEAGDFFGFGMGPAGFNKTGGYIDNIRFTAYPRYIENVEGPYPTIVDGDPLIANVTALVRVEDTVDELINASTVTLNGTAAVDATTSKYGNKSLSTVHVGNTFRVNYASIPEATADDFYFPGEFTMEGWFYTDGTPGGFIGFLSNGSTAAIANGDWTLQGTTSNTIVFAWYSGGWRSAGSTAFTANTWHHVAVQRTATQLEVWVDGFRKNTYSSTGWDQALGQTGSGDPILINGPVNVGTNYDVDGYAEEVRITKGVARYNVCYTPITTRFPEGPRCELNTGGDTTAAQRVELLFEDTTDTGPDSLATVDNSSNLIAAAAYSGTLGARTSRTTDRGIAIPSFILNDTYCVEFWLRVTTAADNTHDFVSWSNGTTWTSGDWNTTNAWYITWNKLTGELYMQHKDAPYGSIGTGAGGLSVDNTWNHFACMRYKIGQNDYRNLWYKNGTPTLTPKDELGVAAPYQVGFNTGYIHVPGSGALFMPNQADMDNFRIWNKIPYNVKGFTPPQT